MRDSVKIVKDSYNKDPQMEWGRIADRPEFLLTCRYLDRYIKPGERILDIGGGPGRYSIYLAKRGCRVTLFDLAEENVRFALERAGDEGVTIDAVCGDAREADRLVSGQFDHVLIMGPLYHLLDEKDRERAVWAELKLLKPGGLLFASFISMYGGLVYAVKIDPDIILSEVEMDVFFRRCLIEKKSYAGPAFTDAFLIQPGEVLPFMSRFPLEKLHLFGQEGVLSPNENNIMTRSPEVVNAWLDFAEATCEHEELLCWSEHLMYIGRKP